MSTQPALPRSESLADSFTPSSWDRRRDRRTLVAVFIVIWAIYLATATYWVGQINDNRATTQSAWSLGTRGTLALPEAWRGEVDWQVEGTDGRLYTNRFPGPVLWATPFHAAGQLLFPRPEPGHPHLLNYAPSGVAAATASALAVAASFVLFRRLAERRLAVGATVALGLGTSVWSAGADAMWPHGVTHFMLVLGLLAVMDGKHLRGGLAFAGAILCRPHLAIVPAVVGIWHGLRHRDPWAVIKVGTASALGLLAIVAYSRILFGTWLPIAGYNTYAVDGLGGTSSTEFVRRAALMMIDPARGLLIYSPILLILLPFVRHGWRASPAWARAAGVAGVAYLVIQLRANTYHGGAQFFGSRLTIETLVLLSPLLLRTWQAFVVDRIWLRRLSIGIVAASVVFHALGATIWARPFLDRTTFWIDHLDEVCEDESVVGCPNRGIPGHAPDQ